MLQNVMVDYYGSPTQLPQISSITTPDAETLMVNVYDKNAMDVVEKALQEADLGLNPSNDGNVIRLKVPPLTDERRQELAKKAKSVGEDSKVAVRNVRKDVLKKAKGLDLSKDEQKAMETDIQKVRVRAQIASKQTCLQRVLDTTQHFILSVRAGFAHQAVSAAVGLQ